MDPFAPALPPAGSGSQQAGTFGVGSAPGGSTGGHTQGAITPPFDWQALFGADQTAQGRTQQGLDALMGGLGQNSGFGQMLMQLFGNRQGFSPELLARLKTQMAETNAGSTQNALTHMGQGANASGFGNSAGAQYAQGQIRQQGAQNLMRNQTALDVENERMGMQGQQGFGALLAQLFGQDAGSRGLYANIQSQRQSPIYPSTFTPGQGGNGGAPAGTPQGAPGARWDPMVGGSGGWASR